MSDEKIKEKPPVPPVQEKAREPSAPKTSQSAFDKVLEQQKILQQSPMAQGRVAEQGASEQKVREINKWQERHEERQKKDDRDETGSRDKTKAKNKSELTVTREAVGRTGEKKGSGSGGQGGKGHDKGGFGSDLMKRQIAQKKIADIKGLMTEIGKSSFAGKLALASAAALKINPQQIQALVNRMIQSIAIGRNELGWTELRLVLKDPVFAGLRLRFISKHGKVSIHFDTKDAKVKKAFENEAPKIRAALEEKGVVVEELKIG